MRYSIKTITLIGVLSVQALLAQTVQPTTFTAQGVLRDAQGRSLADDTYGMLFQIYGNINGTGNAIWSEAAQVDVVNGVWAYTLGSDASNILDDLDVDGTNYLKITVGGDALSPLTQISLRPYELLNVSGGGNVVPTTGNVGIGTDNPNFKLDVQPNTQNARIGRAEIGAWPADENYAYFGNQNLNHSNSGDYAILQKTDGTTYLNSRSGKKMHFRISNSDKMVMLSNGRIGINSTNPSEILDVVGNIELNGYLEMQPWSSGPKIADTFGGNTSKSIINFTKISGSNDPGAIIHETRGSGGSAEQNEGVLHLMPSDDNAYGDYVSIHGTDDADKIKLHTDGTIEGVSNLDMSGYVKGGSGSVVRKIFYNDNTTETKYASNTWVNTWSLTIPKVYSDSHVIIEVQYSYIFNGSGGDVWYGRLKSGSQTSLQTYSWHGRHMTNLSPHYHKFTNSGDLTLQIQHVSNGATAASSGGVDLGNSDDVITFHGLSIIVTEVRP